MSDSKVGQSDCAGSLIRRTPQRGMMLLCVMALGCGGPPGRVGDPGERAASWERENIYCLSSSTPDRESGTYFKIVEMCEKGDRPISASCYVSDPDSFWLGGGEQVNWETTSTDSAKYECTFSWIGTPPERNPAEVGAKTQMCCLRKSSNSNG